MPLFVRFVRPVVRHCRFVMTCLETFIAEHRITEVECLVPDLSGIARGKIVPAEKFLRIIGEQGLRLPEATFVQTVTGDYPADEDITADENGDVFMVPDPATIRRVPWYRDATAQVICDCVHADGRPVPMASRWALRRVLELYRERGWQPVVAPELEFFLVQPNRDPDYPLLPAIGRSGRPEGGRQACGIDAVNEFDPIVADIYEFCALQGIDIDTLAHESGAAQIEINFNHGEALEIADQTFLFKRTAREAALRHNVHATFMAKPMQSEPGSAMHIHQSVRALDGARNLFANEDGNDSRLFLAHIAGLQKYLPAAMPLLAPNVNSYRRLVAGADAPVNVHWGRDNRTTGLRVPVSSADNRRVENRIAGADCNPYLVLAASLACGYLGMVGNLEPTDPVRGSAYRLAHTLPRHLVEALGKFNACRPFRDIFGQPFIDAVTWAKKTEYDAYHRVISSWEREFLLLNV